MHDSRDLCIHVAAVSRSNNSGRLDVSGDRSTGITSTAIEQVTRISSA